MILIGIGVFVVLVTLVMSVKVVSENEFAVIQFLGKYSRTLRPGVNLMIPFLETSVSNGNFQQENFEIKGKYPTKDKVIVDVTANLIYSNGKSEEAIKNYTYVLGDDVEMSITAVIENSLRTYLATEDHEGVLVKKTELANHIKEDIKDQFEEWGLQANSFQITAVNFPDQITNAMNDVVASEQQLKSARNRAEAKKIELVKEAEAEKERKQLQGEGIALEREAIAKGISNSVATVIDSTHQSAAEALAVLSMTQYLDTIKTIGTANNSKVLFVDSSVDSSSKIFNQILQANMAGEQKGKE